MHRKPLARQQGWYRQTPAEIDLEPTSLYGRVVLMYNHYLYLIDHDTWWCVFPYGSALWLAPSNASFGLQSDSSMPVYFDAKMPYHA